MTRAHRNDSTDARGGEESSGGNVFRFPRERRRPRDERQRQWTFSVEVNHVGGAEGEWLADELAVVLRDLLAWAQRDSGGSIVGDESCEEDAA